jgi:hypothetical protein
MMILSTIILGTIFALIPYIPKNWIEKHIVMEIDPNDENF